MPSEAASKTNQESGIEHDQTFGGSGKLVIRYPGHSVIPE